MYRLLTPAVRLGALVLSSLLVSALAAGCGSTPLPSQLDDLLPGDATALAAKLESVFAALQTPVAADTLASAGVESEVAADIVADVSGDASTPVEDRDVASDDLAFFADRDLIVGGTLVGRFVSADPNSTSDDVGGLLHGQWRDNAGTVLATFRGRYHPLPANDLPTQLTAGGVFHAHFFDDAGRPTGQLNGRYGHADDGQPVFFGRWFDRDDHLIGLFRGQWQAQPGTGGGNLIGHWAALNICDEVASLPAYQFDAADFAGLDDATLILTDPLGQLSNARGYEAGAEAGGVLRDAVVANLPPLPDCIDPTQPFGFLNGRYHGVPRDPNDPNLPPFNGVFRGQWRAANADVTGGLVGRYVRFTPDDDSNVAQPPPAVSETPDGPPVLRGRFYGRYVGADGAIQGLVRGVYGRSANGLGVFRGEYFAPDATPRGQLLGRWALTPGRIGGPFAGVWFGAELAIQN